MTTQIDACAALRFNAIAGNLRTPAVCPFQIPCRGCERLAKGREMRAAFMASQYRRFRQGPMERRLAPKVAYEMAIRLVTQRIGTSGTADLLAELAAAAAYGW